MKEKCTHILVVAGMQSYPAQFGGAYDIWERLKGLKKMGYCISLAYVDKCSPTPSDIDGMKKVVDILYFVGRKNQVQDLISPKPLQVVSRRKLKSIDFKDAFDLVLLEGEFVGEILDNPTLKYKKLAIRVHNNEAYYFNELKKSSRSLIRKIYYSLECPKIERYSNQIMQKADRLWYISSDECKQSTFKEKSVFIPPPINQQLRKFKGVDGHKVLFIGSLFMPNNLFAIDWYIEHIHPHFLQDQTYELMIVGKTKEQKQMDVLLQKYKHTPKVTFHFNQEHLLPFFEQAKVFINPMMHGSGVKIKSIEAICNGLPLLSTTIGAEGMGFTQQHYWNANTPKAFREQLQSIFSSTDEQLQQRVEQAQQHLENNHYYSKLENEVRLLCED